MSQCATCQHAFGPDTNVLCIQTMQRAKSVTWCEMYQPRDLDLYGAKKEWFEERAGIREFDGGMRRDDAELAALGDIRG